MSIDRAFREMIRQEIEVQLRPLQNAVSRLSEGNAGLADLAARLSPLGALFGGEAVRRRGPGRPPGAGRTAGRRAAKRTRVHGSNDRNCALIGCKKKARSKGYCAAHYQKYRNLSRTQRLPSDWVEYAPVDSVADVVLPRGRAATKALEEAPGN